MVKVIRGSSSTVLSKLPDVLPSFGRFIKVSVFFENANFLTTSIFPSTSDTNMVLEDEFHNQLHLEGCNCSYGGEGLRAAVSVLKQIGIEQNIAESLVFSNDGLQFNIDSNGEIDKSSVNTSVLFSTSERVATPCHNHPVICLDKNINIDLLNREIMFFNPQYHCFRGFLNLLYQIKPNTFSYYIGDNSPLDNHFTTDGFAALYGKDTPDLRGIEHVNLAMESESLKLSCLIDRQCEIQVIDAIYMALKHETLFPEERYSLYLNKKGGIFKWVDEFILARKKTNPNSTGNPFKVG